jgi:hypothetical protein
LVLTGRALATYNRDTIAPAWEFSAMRLRRSSLDLSQTQTQAGPAARPTGALYAAGSLFSRDGRPTPAPDARQTQQIFTVTTREYLRSWSLSAGHRGPTPVPDAQPCLKSRVMCSLGSMIGARRGGRQRGATRHGWASAAVTISTTRCAVATRANPKDQCLRVKAAAERDDFAAGSVCTAIRPVVWSFLRSVRRRGTRDGSVHPELPPSTCFPWLKGRLAAARSFRQGEWWIATFGKNHYTWTLLRSGAIPPFLSVRCLPCAGLCNDALVLTARSVFRRKAE